MKNVNKIVFALDVPNMDEASKFINMLHPYVGAFKLGLELFISTGGFINLNGKLVNISEITNKPIILDLKLHDIPETVSRAIKVAGDRGFKILTMYIQQKKTIESALKAAEPYGIKLLGVTILTSMDLRDCENLQYQVSNLNSLVMNLVNFSHNCGLHGFVCSPQEVKNIKTDFPNSFCLVPGVRLTHDDHNCDQKRIGTPKQASEDGADLIVIGRPIRDAIDPVKTLKRILLDI